MPCRRLRLDNLDVLHVGRLLDGVRRSCPPELLNDGDKNMLIDRILELRGRYTLRVSKVQGHADEELVLGGRYGS